MNADDIRSFTKHQPFRAAAHHADRRADSRSRSPRLNHDRPQHDYGRRGAIRRARRHLRPRHHRSDVAHHADRTSPRRRLVRQLLPPQNVVVVLREAVRLVAYVLQYSLQRRRVPAEFDRLRLAGAGISLLPASPSDIIVGGSMPSISNASRAALNCPLPPSISKISGNTAPSSDQALEPPANHLAHARKVIDALHGLDLEPPVARS